MRTRRRTYTAATPASLFPEALTENPIVQPLPVSGTRRKLQSVKGRGNRGSKKKKCIRLWDLTIPSEILQGILSRLRLKANIHASLVCKTWCEAAVSVRKSQPRPWLFYPKDAFSPTASPYILADPLGSQAYELNFPELKGHRFSCSRDGWLLVSTESLFFLNPFTREHIYLPEKPPYFLTYCSAFSAAPTSSNCLVISLTQIYDSVSVVINTWRPGETVWTSHRFENQSPKLKWGQWINCVLSNGMFYCLSACGHLGVFDLSRETWNILPMKPCPAFSDLDFNTTVLMVEHEEDVFVMHIRVNNNPLVLKLNLKRKVWEEKREQGGLTIFASYPSSFAIAGLSAEERNKIYTSDFSEVKQHCMYYYSLGDEKSSYPPRLIFLSNSIAWVDPPQNNANL